jgi:hypothetical protein
MNDALIQILQASGPVGAAVLAAGLVVNTLYKQLTQVQRDRIADAQLGTAKLLELVANQHKQQELLMRAIDGNADAVRELRVMIESVLMATRLPPPAPAPAPPPRRRVASPP